jgi:hypothetical protein
MWTTPPSGGRPRTVRDSLARRLSGMGLSRIENRESAFGERFLNSGEPVTFVVDFCPRRGQRSTTLKWEVPCCRRLDVIL